MKAWSLLVLRELLNQSDKEERDTWNMYGAHMIKIYMKRCPANIYSFPPTPSAKEACQVQWQTLRRMEYGPILRELTVQ